MIEVSIPITNNFIFEMQYYAYIFLAMFQETIVVLIAITYAFRLIMVFVKQGNSKSTK